MSKNGNGEGTPPVIENAHIFQEYTYKKITPCDICSQILRGKKMAHGRYIFGRYTFGCYILDISSSDS